MGRDSLVPLVALSLSLGACGPRVTSREWREVQRVDTTMETMGKLVLAIGRYRIDNSSLPTTLEALPEPEASMLEDAWGHRMVYKTDGDSYTIISPLCRR